MEINKRKVAKAVVVGVVVGITLAGLLAVAKLSIHGKYAPGTNVAGIELSYKTSEEARGLLNTAKEQYLETPIKISVLGKTKQFSPKELGVNILVEETISTLHETDARELGLSSIIKISTIQGESKQLVSTVNQDVLNETLNKAFELEAVAPKSASFFFDEKGKLLIKDEEEGVEIDREALAKDLKSAAKELITPEIAVDSHKEQAAVSVEMLEQQRVQIEESLNFEVALLDPVYRDDWYIKLKDHLDWVEFVEKQKTEIPYFKNSEIINDYVAIEINQEKLDVFVDEKISKWLDRPTEDVNIYTGEDGKINIEGKGANGKKVQRRFLKESIELAVEKKIRDVLIPVIDISPNIMVSNDLRDRGIKEIIAVGHTSYYGSHANRIHNVKTGAAKFNGLIIKDGEDFSFNKNLGRVDASTGYKKELVIKKEGTIPEYGGGLCQVSTTMFRAILFAGIPILERNEHSYVVSYYSQILGDGLDATIYLGGADLRFNNDTGNDILVQTYTENDYELYYVFYGTKDGRSVELEGPTISNYRYPGKTVYEDSPDIRVGQTKQVEKSHTGFDVLWYRILTAADGVVTKEPIQTRYRAIPAKILVGTGQ